jgi:ribose transport system permease protein
MTASLGGDAVPWPLGFLISIAVGAGLGFVNGCLIVFVRVPAFVATLGMMIAARGIAQMVSGGLTIGALPSPLGRDALLRVDLLGIGVHATVLIFAVAALLLLVLLRKTVFGRHCFAIGSNEEASFLAGVRVRLRRVQIYTLSGGLAGLGGVCALLQHGSGNPSLGGGYELSAIAACVIGGVSLSGGAGGVVGPVVGAVVLQILRDGLITLNLSPETSQIATGAVIVGGVALDNLRKRMDRSMR